MMLYTCRFDSIDAMNSEELLVKRKKGTKKHLIILAVISCIFFAIGVRGCGDSDAAATTAKNK
jgi:hypothetical protein